LNAEMVTILISQWYRLSVPSVQKSVQCKDAVLHCRRKT